MAPRLGTSTEAHTTTNATSLTFSFTSTGEPLLVRVNLRGQTADPTSITVTYNGVSVPLISGASAINTGSHQYSGLYYLASPATGANNVVVSWTNASACVSGACTVSEGGLPNNGNGATSTSSSASVTITSNVGGLVVDCSSVPTTRTITSDTTEDFTGTSTGATTNIIGKGSHAAGGASVVMSYTIGGGTAAWAMAGCNIPPSSGFFF